MRLDRLILGWYTARVAALFLALAAWLTNPWDYAPPIRYQGKMRIPPQPFMLPTYSPHLVVPGLAEFPQFGGSNLFQISEMTVVTPTEDPPQRKF